MDNPFVKQFSALLQETEKLLGCAEPGADAWEGYGRMRQETFTRLQAADFLGADSEGERAALRELANAVLERDRLLMQKLEESISFCRKALSDVDQGRQALRGYLPARRSSFLQRQV